MDCSVQYFIQIHDMVYAVEHGNPEDIVLIISARGQNQRLQDLQKMQFLLCRIHKSRPAKIAHK